MGNVRAAWGSRRGEQLASDVRFALRQMRRNPGFAAIAIATLALGIGGVTAVFSAFDTVLIRPMPYTDADRLVMIWDAMGETDVTSRHNATPAEWIEWRRLNTVFTDLASSQPGDTTLSGDGEPEQVPARKVSWTFWNVLGVQRMFGRVFTEDEDNKSVRVVVISHGLWQRRYGGASGIIGRTISLNDLDARVVSSVDANQLLMAQRPDRRAAQAGRHVGADTAVHGGIESANHGEGFPRTPLSDRHASTGRNRG